jgi:hypothetical protein
MKRLFSFCLLMLFTSTSFAITFQDLPQSILEMQGIQAKQGTCEKRWPELSETHGIKKEELDQFATLWTVPCAQWSDNVAWTVYVTIKESSHPDGFLTKAIRFVNYHPYEGIVARDVIHNIDWDSANKILRSQYFMNGSNLCGSRAEYKWHGGYQTLQLKTLLKKDNCRDTEETWKPVFNP